jgi:hypothetical protein
MHRSDLLQHGGAFLILAQRALERLGLASHAAHARQ